MKTPIRILALSMVLGAHAVAQSSLFGVKLEGGGASPKTVLFFGDSITEAAALPKDKADRTWVALLQTQSQGWFTTINEGKRDRSTAGVSDFETLLRQKRSTQPDVIAIMLGTNDTRDPSAQCVPRAVNNLRTMILAARKKLGPQFPILLMAPPNLRKADLAPSFATPDQREASLKALATAYAKLAEETKCFFVSTQGVIPEEHFAKGGILPDEVGHVALANAILPALVKAAGFKEEAK